MNYKEMIIDMVQKMNNEKVLEFLYNFIKSLKEKWGV